MDEDLVQNIAWCEKFVKNFVMGAKIDPKVEMDLSTFKIGRWNILQFSNGKLLEESIEEAATVALLKGILSRDPSLVMHHLKELMFPSEGLLEMVPCHRRQHFTASNDLHEHPKGQSSWRESTRMKFMSIQMEYSKMRSEPSEYMWKTMFISIHLESYFGRHAQEAWERNWVNPDKHTMMLDTKLLNATLLNMYNTDGDDSEGTS